VGLAFFLLGLYKKLLLADPMATTTRTRFTVRRRPARWSRGSTPG
jgi:hypothetical protein